MLADIVEKKEAMRKRYVTSERHTIQVNYIDYCDEIAEMIGCRPDFWTIYWQDAEVRRLTADASPPPRTHTLRGPSAGVAT